MAEIEDGEIRKVDKFSYNIGKEDTVEKTKEFLKSVIPIYEHPNIIIEEYVKYIWKDKIRKEEIKQASEEYYNEVKYLSDLSAFPIAAFKAGAEWTDKTAWKPADGDNLPEIDREVIALVEENSYYKVVFAHRPPEYWDGINIFTKEVTRNYTERYDKGEWNQPNVKWWLDLELPKMEE